MGSSFNPVTMNGTRLYADAAVTERVPPLVLEAVDQARQLGFDYCVHPATGRLLSALAAGVSATGTIGETGTGTGAGVAWMLATAPSTTRIVSVELDHTRAAAAAGLFADYPNVTILQGDANTLAAHGPFGLLVLDAPSTPGPLHWETLDPTVQLAANGLLAKDDLWPMTTWPPRAYDSTVDDQRVRWIEHPHLFTTEVTVADGYSVLLGRLRPSADG